MGIKEDVQAIVNTKKYKRSTREEAPWFHTSKVENFTIPAMANILDIKVHEAIEIWRYLNLEGQNAVIKRIV